MTKRYDTLIQAAVQEYLPGHDWRLIKAQIKQESQFNPRAKSSAGAQGLGQFMPKTWKEWSVKAQFAGHPPTDPEAAIFTMCMYMAYLFRQWTAPRPAIDRWCLTLASYNAGLGSILDAQVAASGRNEYSAIVSRLRVVTGDDAEETLTYVERVFQYFVDDVTRREDRK